jgi:hypothetical protein
MPLNRAFLLGFLIFWPFPAFLCPSLISPKYPLHNPEFVYNLYTPLFAPKTGPEKGGERFLGGCGFVCMIFSALAVV